MFSRQHIADFHPLSVNEVAPRWQANVHNSTYAGNFAVSHWINNSAAFLLIERHDSNVLKIALMRDVHEKLSMQFISVPTLQWKLPYLQRFLFLLLYAQQLISGHSNHSQFHVGDVRSRISQNIALLTISYSKMKANCLQVAIFCCLYVCILLLRTRRLGTPGTSAICSTTWGDLVFVLYAQ